MKYCPECRRTYADETLNFCFEDGGRLVENSMPEAADASPETVLSSIAVLPFVNMSADAENEYFCDGLAEELLNALAKIDSLKVAARTSSFSFKGKKVDASEIGRALKVGMILEGSVRKAGNRLRITAQLINTANGFHLWSERYDREVKDLFDVQDEIAHSIIETLKIKLLGEQKAAAAKPPEKKKPAPKSSAGNAEAVELYWKGLYFYHKYTVENWQKSITFYEKAIQKQPAFAPAHAGLALCLSGLAYFNALNAQEVIPRSRAAVERALALDPHLSDAHFTLGNIQFYYDWEWEKAEQSFRRALELNPNNGIAHLYFGIFLFSRLRFDEAAREADAALARDPLSLMVNLYAGWIYIFADRRDEAFRQVRKLIELEPAFYGAYWLLGTLRQTEGLYEESSAALMKAISLGGDQVVLSSLGLTYALDGKREEALNVANELLEMRKTQYISAFNLARIFIGLEDDETALVWLEKAFQERSGELVLLDAIFKMRAGAGYGKTLRANPQFQYLLRRVNIVV